MGLAHPRLGRGGWPIPGWGGGGLVAPGCVVGLQALGGHPETVVHTALLAGLYLAVRGGSGRATWAKLVAAFGAGALVAGVHLLPLFFNLTASTRWIEWSAGERLPIAAALDAALRVVLPDLYGNPAAGTWWGPFNYNATAVFAGALALPLAWMGLRDRIGDRRFKAMAVVTVAAALAAYHVFPVRELMLAVPVVNRMLHHRLLFAVDLGLALFAAAGIDALVRGRRRGVTGASLLVAAVLAAAWWRHHDDWSAAGLLAHQTRWTVWIVVALSLLVVGASLASRRGARACALVAALAGSALTAELVWAHARTNPGLALRSLLPSHAGDRVPGALARPGGGARWRAAAERRDGPRTARRARRRHLEARELRARLPLVRRNQPLLLRAHHRLARRRARSARRALGAGAARRPARRSSPGASPSTATTRACSNGRARCRWSVGSGAATTA